MKSLVLGFSLLGSFADSSYLVVVNLFTFSLPDSVLVSCMFVGIYLFLLGYPICWYVVVCYLFYFCGISYICSFISDIIESSLLYIFIVKVCQFCWSLKKISLFCWFFSILFLLSISFISALMFIISFLLLTLGLVYSSFSSYLHKVSLFIWDFFFNCRCLLL